MKRFLTLFLSFFVALFVTAQTLEVLPTMSPEGGTHNDEVKVSCTFPVGCAGGKYWLNGGEIKASNYNGPITIDHSCTLSVAGVNSSGRIITDVVTKSFVINKVTPPTYVVSPKEGIRKESFYVTRLQWKNVVDSKLDLSAYKEGGKLNGKPCVWLTDESGKTIATNTFSGVWEDGLNGYKIYIYKNYDGQPVGKYQLHVVPNIFVLDGKVYDKEIVLNYEVSAISAPEFDPEPGEYTGSVTVSIKYPTDGSAFYPYYKINGGKQQAYDGPITITETSTIEAYGIDEEFTAYTQRTTGVYTIVDKPADKALLKSPVAMQVGKTVVVTVEPDVKVKYWFDDKMSTAALYEGPVAVDHNCKVSVVAFTEDNHSATVNVNVIGFPVADRGDYGDKIILTPMMAETANITGMSPNGRYAAGFYGSDTSSRGFIWDIEAETVNFTATAFANQVYSVSDDGIGYGWTLPSADISEDEGEEALIWGAYYNGEWIEKPKEMSVNGITADGQLFGSVNGKAALYNFKTGEYTYYNNSKGGIAGVTAKSAYTNVAGGYVTEGLKRVPAIWNAAGEMTTYPTSVGKNGNSVTAISDNGEWALLSNEYRVNLTTGAVDHMISTSYRYDNPTNPEHMNSIANDGTVFGNIDGMAIIYSTDCRWRSFTNYLQDEKDYRIVSRYMPTSVRGVTGDANTILMTCFPIVEDGLDVFTRGMVLRLNAQIAHLAPVNVKAEQMQGMPVVKVSWSAPVSGASSIVSYTVLRDGVAVAENIKGELVYFDDKVESGNEYHYTVRAVYKDGTVSKDSQEAFLLYELKKYLPVGNLNARCAGYDDVVLTWETPIVSMPKLQYFNESKQTYQFGTQFYDSEWAIRIPATDLKVFEGMQIRTFQFLPTGEQRSYRLNLYAGDPNSDEYDPKPFYTQKISPDSLSFGAVNIIRLTTPQELPQGRDLYIALFIQEKGNGGDMLGVSYEGFKSGYTDLARVDGVHETFVAISKNSQDGVTQIVLPLGVGVGTEEQVFGSIISNYQVSDNGNVIATLKENKLRVEDVKEGAHKYTVETIYFDGNHSKPADVDVNMECNEAALTPVEDVTITVNPDNTAVINWVSPLDDDRTLVNWGDLTPSRGFPIPRGYSSYQAASYIPSTLTAPYDGDYEITHIFYYPTDDAAFHVELMDSEGEGIAQFDPDPELNKMNFLKLDEPVTVNASKIYLVTVIAYDAPEGMCPLAYDSSNKWKDGYSNIINFGDGFDLLSNYVQISEHPNWLMGLVVRYKNAKPLPIDGFNVRVDNAQANESILSGNSFTTEQLSKGTHNAAVDVVYAGANVKEGANNRIIIKNDPVGIAEITTSGANAGAMYDITGRRIVNEKANRGIYVVGGKKVNVR